MIQTFHCPNCGAPLDPPPGLELTIRCAFCSSSVVIPLDLRRHPHTQDSLSRDEALQNNPDTGRDLMEIIRLVKSGQNDEAIIHFRESFDTNRNQAELAIERIEQGQVVELSHLLKTKPEVNTYENPKVITNTQNRRKFPFLSNSIACLPIGIISLVLIFVAIAVFMSAIEEGGFLHKFWLMKNPKSEMPLLLSFGESGTGVGYLSQPDLICADKDGNIYISEFQSGRIQQFDNQGKFIQLWNIGDGKVMIRALEVDLNGILYAAVDRTILRIDTTSSSFLDPFPNPTDFFFEDFRVLPDGSIAALVDGDNLVRFNNDGSTRWIVEEAISSMADENDTGGLLTIDDKNNLYLAGRFIEAVFVYSHEGRFLNRIGSEGQDDGQFTGLTAITIDPQGRVMINDWGWLEIFQPDGRWLKKIHLPLQTSGMDFGLNGLFYVVTREPQIYVFDLK
jgi:hypothetical protein